MSEREPTQDELLAMAYVDGELTSAARGEFEQRLGRERGLRREVAALQELELLARAAAPKEPMDHEWEALARDPVQRGALGLGWALLALGLVGLGLFALAELCLCDAPLVLKICLAAVLVGGGFLLGATLRARRRTQLLDPYRKVRR